MKRNVLLCLIFLFLVPLFPVFCQQPVFTKVAPPTGVSWGGIVGMAHDQQGFLWLATQFGLHRYDGYRYVSYFHDPGNKNSLSSSRTETVFISKSGIIWIGTYENGLNRFDPKTNTFTHFTHNPEDSTSLSHNFVTSILEDREGVLWVGTHGGLHRFNSKTGTFTRYRHQPHKANSLSNDQVRVLYEDRQGTLWVGTGSPFPGESVSGGGGLNRFNPKTGTFTRYLHHPSDKSTLIDNKVRAIFEDSRGTFWVGTLGDGLHTMDRAKGTFNRHQYNPNYPEKLSRAPVIGDKNVDGITFIQEDVTGAIWIGTFGGGVSRFDPKSNKVKHLLFDNNPPVGLQDDLVWWVHSSKEGVLWISTLNGELYRADPLHVSLDYQAVGAVVWGTYEDVSGNQWVATSNGLKVFNPNTGEPGQSRVKLDIPATLEKETVASIMEDRKGVLWIGGKGGLWRRDPKNHSFTSYLHDPNKTSSISQGIVATLLESKNGLIWVGTVPGGLNLFDPQTGNFIRFPNDPANSAANSKDKGGILAMEEDRNGNIWIAYNDGGLSKMDRRTGTFKQYFDNTQNFGSIQELASGLLMAVSRQKGVLYYDPKKDDFFHLVDINSGKPIVPNALGLIQDEQENIWVKTNEALVKLNKKGHLLSKYGAELGLNPKAFQFMGINKGRNGNLFIGDTAGYFTLYPLQLKKNKTPPQIHLTDFRLFNKSIVPGGSGPLGMDFGQANGISLNHNQDVFTFEFTGIHFTNPEQNRLLYMLENYDKNWRYAAADHIASYYKVPSGKYKFRVKAISSEGIWAEKAIPLTINPPWWLTAWAFGLYSIIFLSTFWGFVHFRSRQLRLDKKMLEKEVNIRTAEVLQQKEEIAAQRDNLENTLNTLKSTQTQLIQAEKMASLGELTAGIAHEIRNPLNFVNNFSEVSVELLHELEMEVQLGNTREVLNLASSIKENLQKISHHGKRADTIVKSMLLHSRPISNQKELTDINFLTEEYLRLSYHRLQTKDKTFNAELITHLAPDLKEVEVVPQDIGQVLFNLYNNAFYAMQQKQKLVLAGEDESIYKPTITVSTRQLPGQVEIRVRDNGAGIPDKIKSKIFQPFFTTKPSGQGTGLGLSLSYDIITIGHGGTLSVISEEDYGTEFIIKLPVKDSIQVYRQATDLP